MDLPRLVSGPIERKDLYLRNPLEGAVDEESFKNDRTVVCSENDMRCSEMVEVVE